MHKKAIASTAAWALLAHLLTRGSLMVAAIVLARSLEPTSLATYNYFQLTSTLIATYASMGLGATAVKLFAEARQGNDHSMRLAGLFTVSYLASLIGCAFVLVAPEAWLSADLNVSKPMLALCVGVMTLNIVPNGAVIGLEKYRHAVGVAALSAVLAIGGAWLAARLESLSVAVGALVLSALVQWVGQSYVVARSLGWRVMLGSVRALHELAETLGFAGPMLLVSLMSSSAAWIIGRLILFGASGEYEFAVYSIGLQWFALGLVLPGMFSRVMLPKLVRRRASDCKEQSSLVRSGLQMAVVSAAFVATFGMGCGSWLFRIYGARYETEGWIVAAFLACAVLYSPVNVLGNAIIAHNGQLTWLGLTASWFVVLVGSASAAVVLGHDISALQAAAFQCIAATLLALLAFMTAKARNLV